ncbi:hypothetical protein BXZ70DRAFT_905132 [Cristinia sonorae]|uniref:Uncharacterized protein n=1 Tax=Cristinia sonorae TaxID=1940300 RepID=A0A8K0UW34_9AGAR|nr:hypothetical protein BXZ70DRAFT_905132 [Cristinia sonorae]
MSASTESIPQSQEQFEHRLGEALKGLAGHAPGDNPHEIIVKHILETSEDRRPDSSINISGWADAEFTEFWQADLGPSLLIKISLGAGAQPVVYRGTNNGSWVGTSHGRLESFGDIGDLKYSALDGYLDEWSGRRELTIWFYDGSGYLFAVCIHLIVDFYFRTIHQQLPEVPGRYLQILRPPKQVAAECTTVSYPRQTAHCLCCSGPARPQERALLACYVNRSGTI